NNNQKPEHDHTLPLVHSKLQTNILVFQRQIKILFISPVLRPINLSTYFPIMSNSRLMGVLDLYVEKMVFSIVWGMIETETMFASIAATVRLTPSIAIDPNGITLRSNWLGIEILKSQLVSRCSMDS